MLFIDRINFRYRSSDFFKMFTEINKGIIFFNIVAVSGNESFRIITINSEIDSVTSTLGDFFNPADRVLTVLLE